jgi:hypothetical protein
MNAPTSKTASALRIASVVFALLMIGGYAVVAQMRARRGMLDGNATTLSSRPVVSQAKSPSIGELQLDRVSLFLNPRSTGLASLRSPYQSDDRRTLAAVMRAFVDPDEAEHRQSETMGLSSKSGAVQISPKLIERMMARLIARTPPESPNATAPRNPQSVELGGVRLQSPPAAPTASTAAAKVRLYPYDELALNLHPRPTPWIVMPPVPSSPSSQPTR